MKIKLQKRDVEGKKVKSLRAEHQVPANVYGPNRESVNVVVDLREITKIYDQAGHNSLIEVEIEGESGAKKVLIKEVQTDPISEEIKHVSFFEVDMSRKIKVNVPVEIVGMSPAVKSNVGLLVVPVNSVRVQCLPENLIPSFVVDISNMANIGDAFRIADLDLGDKVKLASKISPKQIIAFIAKPQKRIVLASQTEDGAEASEEEATEE